MQFHGTREEQLRQEIRCSDCGHRYLSFNRTLTSLCPRCSNIEYLPNIIERQRNERSKPTDEKNAAAVKPLDSAKINEILFLFPEEWRLWAALVENYQDPNFHSAYLARAARLQELPIAAERYGKHRKVMAGIAAEQWQAKLSELQLKRVSDLQLITGERLLDKNILHYLPKFLWEYERTQKVIWVTVGIILVMLIARWTAIR